MVSHEGFKTLGYVYAIFGILGSILQVVSSGATIEVQTDPHSSVHILSNYYQNIATGLVTLVFFIILFAGIYHKNLTIVKVYKAFLIIYGALAQIFIVAYIGFTIFDEQKTESSAVFTLALCAGLAVFAGFFLLCLWIVNGVIKYIEHGRETNATEPRLANVDDQQKIMKYEAVLTRY